MSSSLEETPRFSAGRMSLKLIASRGIIAIMDDTKKMLRVIINGQSAMKSELLMKIDSVDKKLTNRIDGLDSKIDGLGNKVNKGFKKVNQRIDKLGKSLAYLEDDTPTREEHDKLEERVGKLEQKVVTV